MEDKPITSIKAGLTSYLIRHPIRFIVPLGIFVVLSWMVIVLVPPGESDFIMIGYLTWALLFAAAPPLIIAQSRVKDEFMQQFADANGYQLSPTGDPAEFDGSLFQLGDSKQVSDVIRATYLGCLIVLLGCNFRSGKSTGEYAVLQLQFDADMPDLFLQPAILPGSPFVSKASRGSAEYVRLEGDFSKVLSLDI